MMSCNVIQLLYPIHFDDDDDDEMMAKEGKTTKPQNPKTTKPQLQQGRTDQFIPAILPLLPLLPTPP
jgi:hypothetical protein